MSAPAAIELRGLTKDFTIGLRGVKLRAVDDVTLSVGAGEIFGLLGSNGSGKSTTIKIILGLMMPTVGECAVFGVPSNRIEARLAVGYLPEAPDFYRYLTGRELVAFYDGLCGLGRATVAERVAKVLDAVGLTAAADRRVGTYSKGMLQRIGLAQALVHDPRLLILDEPTAGVDPIGAAAMAEQILQLKAQGKTVLITSHLLDHIEDLCDRIAILDRGRLILQGSVRELLDGAGPPSVTIDALPPDELAELRAWLAARGRKLDVAANRAHDWIESSSSGWAERAARTMTRVPFSFHRVRLIAGNTLREAGRQRVFGFIVLLALALVVGVQWFRDLNFGSSELKFLADFGFGAMAFFGAALAIVAASQLFFSEIEQRTALTLLAKPVWRAEFLFGKFLGLTVLVAVFCGTMTLLVAGILWSRETALMRQLPDAFAHGRAVDYGAIAAAGFAQAMKLALLSALTLLVATFARTQLFATATGFLLLVACHLQTFAQAAAARGGSAIQSAGAQLLGLALPDFQAFDLSESVVGGEGIPWSQVVRLSAYSAGYLAAVMALATVSFRQREI